MEVLPASAALIHGLSISSVHPLNNISMHDGTQILLTNSRCKFWPPSFLASMVCIGWFEQDLLMSLPALFLYNSMDNATVIIRWHYLLFTTKL